jgi:hypothetical protein
VNVSILYTVFACLVDFLLQADEFHLVASLR